MNNFIFLCKYVSCQIVKTAKDIIILQKEKKLKLLNFLAET